MIEREHNSEGLNDQLVRTRAELESALNSLKYFQRHYSLIFDYSPFAISFLDPTGIILDCNINMEILYKFTQEELLGRNANSLMTLASRELSKNYFYKLSNLKTVEFEFQAKRSDSSLIEVYRKAFPLKDDEGNFAGVLAFDQNISDKKRNEELLNLRSTALELADNSIVITNIRGDVVWVNPAFTKLTGYPQDEITYKNIRILNSGKQSSSFYKNLWDTILAGKVWHGELINKRKDGSEWYEEQTITPVHDSENNIIYFISIKQDISERKEAEKQAHIHREQLIQADKMVALGTLVSGVAHEINNPNNFIMLNTPLLKKTWDSIQPILDEYYNKNGDFFIGNKLKYSKIKESIPNLLNGITDGAKRIKHIVQELKDFARKETSELNQNVDINSVVNAAINLLSNLIKKSTNNFHVEFAEDLPNILGNFQRLEQVVINLIENSCQALRNKESAINVKTSYDNTKGTIIIEVRDEGIGMDSEIIKEITDPFFTTKRELGGTGLGLSVSSKIVIAHGGKLEFDSKLEKGTMAQIKLPVTPNGKIKEAKK
jgi:PAS domain S-box-containing protein